MGKMKEQFLEEQQLADQNAMEYDGWWESLSNDQKEQLFKDRDASERDPKQDYWVKGATLEEQSKHTDWEDAGYRWRDAPVPEEQSLPPSFRSEHEKKWATPPEDTASEDDLKGPNASVGV
jgi:hypothetical protein